MTKNIKNPQLYMHRNISSSSSRNSKIIATSDVDYKSSTGPVGAFGSPAAGSQASPAKKHFFNCSSFIEKRSNIQNWMTEDDNFSNAQCSLGKHTPDNKYYINCRTWDMPINKFDRYVVELSSNVYSFTRNMPDSGWKNYDCYSKPYLMFKDIRNTPGITVVGIGKVRYADKKGNSTRLPIVPFSAAIGIQNYSDKFVDLDNYETSLQPGINVVWYHHDAHLVFHLNQPHNENQLKYYKAVANISGE